MTPAKSVQVNCRRSSSGSRSSIIFRTVCALAGALVGELRQATDHGGVPLPDSVLAALSRRDLFSDRRVHTEQEGPGIARGILDSGALLLERDDGSRVSVVAGSVRLA